MYHLLVQFVSNTRTTCVVFSNYPVNRPDPEAFWLWPAHGQNWAWCYMPDPTSCIRFSSVFPKKALIVLCKTDPDLIWMTQQGFGQTLVSRNHLARFWAGCKWLATSLPLSDLVVFSHRRPRSCCAKWAQVRFSSGWLCPILAKRDLVRKQAGVQESSGLPLANASEPIQIGCESDPASLLGTGIIFAVFNAYTLRAVCSTCIASGVI